MCDLELKKNIFQRQLSWIKSKGVKGSGSGLLGICSLLVSPNEITYYLLDLRRRVFRC